MAGDVQYHILGHRLQCTRHVAVAVRERLTWGARGPERLYKRRLERSAHAVLVVAEIVHVDREPSRRLEAHNIAHTVHERGVATGCQRHHRALLERMKAEIASDESVDHADAVEEAAVPLPLNVITCAGESTSRSIITITIDDENARLLERRDKEDRGV